VSQSQKDQRRKLIGHLAIYLVVNIALVMVNLAVFPGQMWLLLVTVIWGLYLAFRFVDTFLS
jgi:hypothetical protein